MSPQSELLTAARLGRRASSGSWLVRNVSASLRSGQAVGLIGPSGSGKTVFLRLLGMLDPIDEGTVTWLGEPVRGSQVPHFRNRCIYLHQRLDLGEGTVEQALKVPLAFQLNSGVSYDRPRIVRWLELLGRDVTFLEKSVATISGGESQIVALLRAMQLDPVVVLLDEPTSALDDDAAFAVERLVRDWKDAGTAGRAYIWVSHDADQAERIADVHWKMRDGELYDIEPTGRSSD